MNSRGRLALDRADLEQGVPARFEQVAASASDRLALTGAAERWTYAALDRRVNQLANAILERTRPGIGCVACLTDHSPSMVIGTLAVLKAAKAYLFVHPGLPQAAQRQIVVEAAPALLLTTAALAPRAREIAGEDCHCLVIEEIGDAAPAGSPRAAVAPDDPAAIFYTSGSTGRPRGVVKRHGAILHRAWLSGQHDGVGPDDRQSLLTYCSFATSESDVFGALLNGATLALHDVGSHGFSALAAWIDRERVTILHPPVLLFRRFLATLSGTDLFPSVRLVCLAGETVVAADIEGWRRHFSRSCALRHRFSSTEAGHLAVGLIEPDGASVPRGVPVVRPVPDKQLLLVDEHGRGVAVGDTGELVVRSAYLSDGYWRRPEESAADFKADPAFPGQRVYRTGDLGRFSPDGSFEFLGRRDDQVKVRGYRVDTREVERALLELDGPVESAVIACRADDETHLEAFVVPAPGTVLRAEALREGLRRRLPEWKVPARIHAIEAMPMTFTGKIDRQRLRERLPPTPPAPSDGNGVPAGVESELAQIYREILKLDAASPEASFLELGGNSITAMMVSNRIEQRFGFVVGFGEILRAGTIRELAGRLSAHAELP